MRALCIVVGLIGLSVVQPTSASADGAEGSDYNYVGPSPARQYVHWSKPDRRVRMFIEAPTGMSTDKCIDSKIDWNTTESSQGNDHYDSRVLRNCKPGSTVETDGGNNGYWEEDSTSDDLADWNSRGINRVREVVSYMVDDDDLAPQYGSHPPQWSYQESGDTTIYNNNANAPATDNGTDWWSRVKTRYQDGTTAASTDQHRPYNCANQPVNC